MSLFVYLFMVLCILPYFCQTNYFFIFSTIMNVSNILLNSLSSDQNNNNTLVFLRLIKRVLYWVEWTCHPQVLLYYEVTRRPLIIFRNVIQRLSPLGGDHHKTHLWLSPKLEIITCLGFHLQYLPNLARFADTPNKFRARNRWRLGWIKSHFGT